MNKGCLWHGHSWENFLKVTRPYDIPPGWVEIRQWQECLRCSKQRRPDLRLQRSDSDHVINLRKWAREHVQ